VPSTILIERFRFDQPSLEQRERELVAGLDPTAVVTGMAALLKHQLCPIPFGLEAGTRIQVVEQPVGLGVRTAFEIEVVLPVARTDRGAGLRLGHRA
jgi:hypothetical protein